MKIQSQHIAVLGAGESGGAAARLLLAEGARVTVVPATATTEVNHTRNCRNIGCRFTCTTATCAPRSVRAC